MHSRRAWSVLASTILACSEEEPDTHEVTAHLEPEPFPVVAVACNQPGENVLRWSCAVTVEPPQPATLVVAPVDGGRTQTLPLAAGVKDVPVRFLRSLTTYAATVTAGTLAASTTFTTEDLPEGVGLTYEVEGSSTVPYLLHPTPCIGSDVVLVSDTEGAVVWYESLGVGPDADLLMVQLTEDDTVLVLGNGELEKFNVVREIDWDGNTLFEVGSDGVGTEQFHHDATKHAGLVYTLFRHDVTLDDGLTYKEDGYYVFDQTGARVQEWHLFDHFLPPLGGEPDETGAIDISHTNSIDVSDDLQILLSLRFLSAVANVQGDPTEPSYGDITWRLSGNPNDPAFGTDFALVSSATEFPTFLLQHHAVSVGPDRFTMFDNRGFLADQVSRVIGIGLDREAGVADIDESYPLDQHCNFQGAAFFTAGGNPMATCANPRSAYEWDAGVPETPRFKLSVSCSDGTDSSVGRFVPLDHVPAG